MYIIFVYDEINNYLYQIKLLFQIVVVKIAHIGTRTLESGDLSACPFPAGTLNSCRAVYSFVHCAHFIAFSIQFHYNITKIILPKQKVRVI